MKEQNFLRTSSPRAFLAVGALTAAVAGGYVLRGAPITAQNVNPNASTTTPVVATAATGEAVSMQQAFNQVSRAIEPAVVTIRTADDSPASASSGRGGASPFGGRGQGGPGGDSFGDLEEFFRRRFGAPGGRGGQDDPNVEPNSFRPNSTERAQLSGLWREMQERRGGGLGSGMIYRPDGFIITNAHVVGQAKTVSVTLNDGRKFKKARVVGRDERTDIAVVKIDGDRLPSVRLADSSKVNVGDWAIAVGNPFGLEHTVTVGVISAKAREVDQFSAQRSNGGEYLQTDASINPGNSGGPLCDIHGRVIGVNNAIISRSGGNEGIGFAIPANTVRNIADRIVSGGRVVRGYLGVGIQSVDTAEAAAGLDLPVGTRGVLIGEISEDNGPGAKAGLRSGDLVTQFNGKAVSRSQDLVNMVGDAPVGSTVTLTVLRDGRTQELRATLAELKDTTPAAPRRPDAPEAEENAAPGALGLSLKPVTPRLVQQFGLKGNVRGLVVTAVKEGSPAAEAGLQRGDLIESVGQTPVATQAEYEAAVNRLLGHQTTAEKSVALRVNREGKKVYIFVTVE